MPIHPPCFYLLYSHYQGLQQIKKPLQKAEALNDLKNNFSGLQN